MKIAEIIGYVAGERPAFHEAQHRVRIGDRFGRSEGWRGTWIYVEVTGGNDLGIPAGCVYARAYCKDYPDGRDGHCKVTELDLRIDPEAWELIRESGWCAPGEALDLEHLMLTRPGSVSTAGVTG